MKKLLLLLLLGSAALNAAWWLGYVRRPAVVQVKVLPAATSRPRATALSASDSLAAALAAGDDASLAAVGFSPDDIRAFKLGRITTKYFELIRAARPQRSASEYWRSSGMNYNKMDAEQKLAMNRAQRGLMEGIHSVYGDEDVFSGGPSTASFLPQEKREKIDKIQQDYDDMAAELNAATDGVQLPADKAKAKWLEEEKERDITAAMTPEEKAEYDLRSSATAQTIRNRYGDAIQSEDVYKKVYDLQKAFDDQKKNGVAVSDADQTQLQKQIKAAIGEDAYTSYQRSNDQEYKTLNTLESRLGLPASTADQIYASRDTYAAQSQQIMNNADLSPKERKEQLSAVADQAKADLVAKLGQDGADAYTAKANWMQMLKNGNAFSTDPDAAPENGFSSNGTTVSRYRPPAK